MQGMHISGLRVRKGASVMEFTHFDAQGHAAMVEVIDKEVRKEVRTFEQIKRDV